MQTYLVSFVYTANSEAFIELVQMTETEKAQLWDILAPVEATGQIADLYIGPLQATPTPFGECYPRLLRAVGRMTQSEPAG